MTREEKAKNATKYHHLKHGHRSCGINLFHRSNHKKTPQLFTYVIFSFRSSEITFTCFKWKSSFHTVKCISLNVQFDQF